MMSCCAFCYALFLTHPLPFKQASDSLKSGTITIEEFRGIYRTIAHRCEIHDLFKTQSPNHKLLPLSNLVQFLRKEQFQPEVDEVVAAQLIAKFEPIEEGTLDF